MKKLRRSDRRLIVHGMIATLVFYSVLLAWQVPAMALASALAPDLAAHTVILCTPGGPKVVALDAEGSPVERSDLPDPAKACPVCQGVAGSVTPLVSAAPELKVSATWLAVEFANRQDRIEGRHALIRRGHDPPSQS